MTPQVFLDTNVVGYAIDPGDAEKQRLASHILTSHASDIVVSTQVLVELFSVATTKFGMSTGEAESVVQELANSTVVPADRSLVLAAAERATTTGLSIWDAMIASAAIHAGCDTIYTEDSQLLDADLGINVENPFT